MMTEFRALCAELADAYLRTLEHINNSTWLGYEPSDDPLLQRARASLADEPPEPAPPADGEVAELVSAVHAAYAAYGWVEEKQFIRFFDEVSRLASVIEEGCDCSVDGPINWQDEIELMCQRLKPVPVSERPWEREGWCDVEGRFWAEHISRSGVASWRCAAASDLGGWAVRCLPAHALPLPEVGE